MFHLSKEWAKKGKKVAVYGNFSWLGIDEGVDYIEFEKFNFWDEYHVLILWRFYACYPYLSFDLKANKIFLDLHDNNFDHYAYIAKYREKFDFWMTKSIFQKEMIETIIIGEKLPNAISIENGVRTSDFSVQIKESRNPFRICYCSCYTRGLYRILKNIWPIIYNLEPKAELHVYYGMDYVQNQILKNEIKLLLSQSGIMDHGRQPVEIINREKHLSSFQLYYTDNLAEIDCISIRESLVAGCIPLISNTNIFKYRDGIHIQWLPDTNDFNYQIACDIIGLMHNENIQTILRNEYYKSPTIITWQKCAEEWLKLM